MGTSAKILTYPITILQLKYNFKTSLLSKEILSYKNSIFRLKLLKEYEKANQMSFKLKKFLKKHDIQAYKAFTGILSLPINLIFINALNKLIKGIIKEDCHALAQWLCKSANTPPYLPVLNSAIIILSLEVYL